ncbi:hypothetical protein Pyn_21409 [Prunus yedoensis var. nudiflora]|uniref:Uncharacterized protein n=1 Tax=Prunus yedoensis var. nudiflora TaxID=2094558 RepID=A0A314ZJB9_PRUYE|nr:hypothetical protein Pyn_21409 [Prunus yedoensis var. nudiflora]
MDVVRMVDTVRKIVAAEIVSVGPAKEDKKERDAADPSAVPYGTWTYSPFLDENPNACSIS